MAMTSRSSSTSTSSTNGIPRVGGVRCYWSLMTPRFPDPNVPGSTLDLFFVHPDPVLATHLAKQKMSLLGRGFMEFIHPAEREQARRDLTQAISADDLQGSVTRMRFARLSRVRTILGCKPEEIDMPTFANLVVEDDEYLVLDLVLNWVADGLLLAFLHAIRDTDSIANNDPNRIHEGWSNFCGTPIMEEEQIIALHHNIAENIPIPAPTRFPPSRIFQIHTSPTSPVRPDSLIFSWPPPRPPGAPVYPDGSYSADEYSDLMRGVDMDPAQLPSSGEELRTNCTTRFGAKHSITTEGVYRHVESVFIPYGCLIFCCFQTTKQVEMGSRPADPQYISQAPAPDWQQPAPDWHSRPYDQYTQPLQPPIPHPMYDQSPVQAHQISPGTRYDQPHDEDGHEDASLEQGGSGGRPMVRPPGDVECCRICGTRESPEWRRSEGGVKDLCNACGLRLARQVAKREGKQKPRKKKDKFKA